LPPIFIDNKNFQRLLILGSYFYNPGSEYMMMPITYLYFYSISQDIGNVIINKRSIIEINPHYM